MTVTDSLTNEDICGDVCLSIAGCNSLCARENSQTRCQVWNEVLSIPISFGNFGGTSYKGEDSCNEVLCATHRCTLCRTALSSEVTNAWLPDWVRELMLHPFSIVQLVCVHQYAPHCAHTLCHGTINSALHISVYAIVSATYLVRTRLCISALESISARPDRTTLRSAGSAISNML